MDELKNSGLESKLCKLESDLNISTNVNDELSDKLVVLEWKCHTNKQCSRRECLKFLSIPGEFGDGLGHWRKSTWDFGCSWYPC